MFFSKKADQEKIATLEASLASAQKELVFYKAIASFSQEEMLVALDDRSDY